MEGAARVIRWDASLDSKSASQNLNRDLDSKSRHWAKPAVPLHPLLVHCQHFAQTNLQDH